MFWHAAAYVLTFPEGIFYPALRHSWYAALCAAWLPIGGFLMWRAWREDHWTW